MMICVPFNRDFKLFNPFIPMAPTMPTFNSCTKCVGSPGIIHDSTLNCHPVSWAWMTSKLEAALTRKLGH